MCMCVQVQSCVCCIVHRENRGADDKDEEARHESQCKQNLRPLELAMTRCSFFFFFARNDSLFLGVDAASKR